MALVRQALEWLGHRYRVRLALRAIRRAGEIVRYAMVRPSRPHHFWIVSSSRNAGAAAVHCLESVDRQRYDRSMVTHVYIDDASSDDTPRRITDWLHETPDHAVRFICRKERRGGTSNNLDGFRMAPAGSIVIELNGDDRLPDPGVLAFLDRVYQDPATWMTYNTQRESTGVIPFQLPPPRWVRRDCSYREHEWATSHLHSFRRRLFDHVPEETMIDPATGDYWASADDVALYLTMLELAGDHARHVSRITCLYNFHEQTEFRLDRDGQLDRARRIRQQPRAAALDAL